ncbi:hypothetical protein [Chitiniphilus eburneus]|uniref:hypothetical protein n=1 Tax=Chitiniphilus eburneus TaxID=2571148 RepID=UPI0035CE9B49
MQTYRQIFAAPGVWPLQYTGRYFRLMETSGGPVNVSVFGMGREVARATGVYAGYYFALPDGAVFDRIDIESEYAGRVVIAVSPLADVGYDRVSGLVDARISTALSVINRPFVSIATTETLIVPGNPNRASLRLFNSGDKDIWIGGAGLVLADAAIKIAPGGLWVEEAAPGATWVGMAPTATGSTPLKVQEILY